MNPPASSLWPPQLRACILGGIALTLLSGCPPAREPLPSGLPPEYETPRSYEPETNIDGAGAESDQLPDEPPPPAPAEPAPAEPAPAAPASAEPGPAEPGPAPSPAPDAASGS